MYCIKELANPFLLFKGSLVECYNQSKGLGNYAIYRLESEGWLKVSERIMNWDICYFITKNGKRMEICGFKNALKMLRSKK